jgi:hypothetical protein
MAIWGRLLLCAALTSATCDIAIAQATGAASAKHAKPYFSVTISAPQIVKAGSVAIVDIAVTNTSKSTTYQRLS